MLHVNERSTMQEKTTRVRAVVGVPFPTQLLTMWTFTLFFVICGMRSILIELCA